MAQNPQVMLAQQNVATVCHRGLETVEAITQELSIPLEVPQMNSDRVSLLQCSALSM